MCLLMIPREVFPRLTEQNHRLASPQSVGYNCIAWTAGDTEHWWQPGVYWPVEASRDDCGIGALESAFKGLRYEECPDESLQPGFEKIALYGSGLIYTHAARQLPNGKMDEQIRQGGRYRARYAG